MIGILLHKRGHRVLDGSEPKVKTKRIECISEAAFLLFFASVFRRDFLTITPQVCMSSLRHLQKKMPHLKIT